MIVSQVFKHDQNMATNAIAYQILNKILIPGDP